MLPTDPQRWDNGERWDRPVYEEMTQVIFFKRKGECALRGRRFAKKKRNRWTNRTRERQRSRPWHIPWNGNLGEHRRERERRTG